MLAGGRCGDRGGHAPRCARGGDGKSDRITDRQDRDRQQQRRISLVCWRGWARMRLARGWSPRWRGVSRPCRRASRRAARCAQTGSSPRTQTTRTACRRSCAVAGRRGCTPAHPSAVTSCLRILPVQLRNRTMSPQRQHGGEDRQGGVVVGLVWASGPGQRRQASRLPSIVSARRGRHVARAPAHTGSRFGH
jgi:hypothetical protein